MRFLTLGVMFLMAGCGGGAPPPPKTVPVQGTITYKNAPVTKGSVALLSTATAEKGQVSKPAIGQIGPDGKFTLSTITAGDGVIPGEYKVTVESMDGEVSMEEGYEGKKVTSLIPKKYNNINTTDITVTIPDQTEPYELAIELKD